MGKIENLWRNLAAWAAFGLAFSSPPSFAFEIDSFYNRDVKVADVTDQLNIEVNSRIEKAIGFTKSCNLEELYTNVRNQLAADASNLQMVSGMENWVEQNKSIERIDGPTPERSIYYGTSYNSAWKMGFWISLYRNFLARRKHLKDKFNVFARSWTSWTTDPLELCQVPAELRPSTNQMLEMMLKKNALPENVPPQAPIQAAGSTSYPYQASGGIGVAPDCVQFMGDKEMQQAMQRMMEIQKKILGMGIPQCLSLATGKASFVQEPNLQPLVKVNGTLVGTDKLGHFFWEGASYFKAGFHLQGNHITPKENGLKEALQVGVDEENGVFGLASTGVKSYGDMSANYGGFLFWQRLGGGEKPMVKCEENRLKLEQKFNWADYVTPAWDEAINCSEYKDKKFTEHVEQNLRFLGISCPVDQGPCKSLEGRYAPEVREVILGPACKSIINREKVKGAR